MVGDMLGEDHEGNRYVGDRDGAHVGEVKLAYALYAG